jgi:hypothetical protein
VKTFLTVEFFSCLFEFCRKHHYQLHLQSYIEK